MKKDYGYSIVKLGKEGSPESGYKLEFWYRETPGSVKKWHKPRFDKRDQAVKYYENLVEDYKNRNVEGYTNRTGMFAPKAPEAEPEKLTFRAYIENTYRKELIDSTKESSHSGKESELKLLIDYFGDTPLEEITEDRCYEFKDYIKNLPVRRMHKVELPEKFFNPKTKRRSKQYSYEIRETPRAVSTYNHYCKRLQAILNKAAKKKKVRERVELENFIDTGRESVRDITFTFEQFHALLNACEGLRAHLRPVLIGLFETGARLCELKAVTKKDLNLDAQFGYFLNSKRKKKSTDSWRKVYLSKYLIKALLANGFEKLEDGDFVFVQGNHKNSWSKVRRDALKDLKAEGKELFDASLTMKDFRHTHYTNLLESDISESVADRQIAHGLHDKITRRVYGNALRDDFLFAMFQRYEKLSEQERAKLDEAAKKAVA